ncbi:hypothetical protein EQG63_10520 [Flavobacterium amnicola]|uniref:Uncharacterized protein n=1 Tax=Flavobacterium amnicola TaxID=2506422 RepID=A0A4Q1K393_9FLAO|nr:hypothetical protein [Flavobacterium amnicola]RXR17218.1 hypothetical protein EQG63_10520 [Flavobacterium amnicola]
MKEFNNLQEIWKQQQQTTLPDVSQIITKAKKDRTQYSNKVFFQIATLVLVLPVLFWVGSTINFKMSTTYIGLLLMALCVTAFSLVRLSQMITLRKIDLTQKPSLTLNQLEKYYAFQQIVSTKISLAYFIVLNIAFVFYFIEVMQPMSTGLKAFVLFLYVGWMLFAYFYLGKKQKQKEYDRIQEMIDAIKQMEDQYEK